MKAANPSLNLVFAAGSRPCFAACQLIVFRFVDRCLGCGGKNQLPQRYARSSYVGGRIEIRDYDARDAAACHELRRSAFLGTFNSFLPRGAVEAGAGSYSSEGFGQRIGAMSTFVATVDGAVVGFCTIHVISARRAELLYLYINLVHRGEGLGPRLVRHAEQRVLKAEPGLETIFLDTAVPHYNQSFWEHLGYSYAGTSSCDYPTGRIPAARLEKTVTPVA